MIFGYSFVDPFVVALGTVIAIFYLQKSPVRLISFMPTALSIWFFAPTITNLTLWQTIPLLLSGRMLLKGSWRMPYKFAPTFLVIVIIFSTSVAITAVSESDMQRLFIRTIYYLGVIALFLFSYEMSKRPETYNAALKGLVIMGLLYSAYGAYQVLAFYTGLPMRGIVYDASGEGVMVSVAGMPRINSLANEPKRLGYVLFIAAMAAFFLARTSPAHTALKLRWAASGIIAISLMTFAGSYFIAILIFIIFALLTYPSKAIIYTTLIFSIGLVVLLLIPELDLLNAIQRVYESRMAELEVGLDGSVVYRQEFFAIDHIKKNPSSTFFGLGVGQYYSTFNYFYGDGAGYNLNGGLAPLNSLFFELVLDLGIFSTLLIYGGNVYLIIKLRRAREDFLCLSLIFLLAQSLTIINLQYIAFFSGLALGRLSLGSQTAAWNAGKHFASSG